MDRLPALVLLPGSLCDGRVFAPQVAALDHLASSTIGRVDRDDTISGMAARVLAGAPPSFALAGLSLGGIVAMEVIRQAPDRVERLALLDTVPYAETPGRQARRETQIAQAREESVPTLFEREIFPYFLGEDMSAATRDSLLEVTRAMAADAGPEVFARQWRALRDRADACEVLARYPGPTLILCGTADRLCPLDRHREMASLMDCARLVTISALATCPPWSGPPPSRPPCGTGCRPAPTTGAPGDDIDSIAQAGPRQRKPLVGIWLKTPSSIVADVPRRIQGESVLDRSGHHFVPALSPIKTSSWQAPSRRAVGSMR